MDYNIFLSITNKSAFLAQTHSSDCKSKHMFAVQDLHSEPMPLFLHNSQCILQRFYVTDQHSANLCTWFSHLIITIYPQHDAATSMSHLEMVCRVLYSVYSLHTALC